MVKKKKIKQFLRKPYKHSHPARRSLEQVESLLGKLSLSSACSCLALSFTLLISWFKRGWSLAFTTFFKEV
tara:strand:+ start:766 stop:978 length:213 start_codon:yes stop_codon:yes gene_type:complete